MTDFRDFEEYQVPVRGGDLAVLRWRAASPQAPTAVLVHGITGNALAWAGVAEAVDRRVDLVAVDLRGRAYSRDVAPPYGIDADVDDLIAVLDYHGLERAVLGGHSLGAFVACTAAARHPDRVESVVAVDGGVRFGLPPDGDPDEVIDLTVGPAVRKLRMTFKDGEDYLGFHREHPSFVGNWTPQLTAYLGRDTFWLPGGGVVSSCVEEAIRADGRQLVVDDFANDAPNHATCPITLLYAERGMLNQPQGFYSESVFEAAGTDRGRVTARLVPDTNHYTVIGPGAGADAVAAAIVDHTGAAMEKTGGSVPLRGVA